MQAVENPPDLVTAQHDREFLLALGACDVEDAPVPLERLFVEELDAAESDRVRAARHLLDVGQVQEVIAHLLFRDPVREFTVEFRELSNCANVGLDGAIRIAAKLEVVQHPLAERCHDVLSGKG